MSNGDASAYVNMLADAINAKDSMRISIENNIAR